MLPMPCVAMILTPSIMSFQVYRVDGSHLLVGVWYWNTSAESAASRTATILSSSSFGERGGGVGGAGDGGGVGLGGVGGGVGGGTGVAGQSPAPEQDLVQSVVHSPPFPLVG